MKTIRYYVLVLVAIVSLVATPVLAQVPTEEDKPTGAYVDVPVPSPIEDNPAKLPLCVMNVSRWTYLEEANVDSEIFGTLYELAAIDVHVPLYEDLCYYRYTLRHTFLAREYSTNIPSNCLFYPINDEVRKGTITCAGYLLDNDEIQQRLHMGFYQAGQGGPFIGTFAEDWVDKEYFWWIILGWVMFLPAIET